VSGLEQLLEVLDLRIQGNAQHVDLFEVLVADLFAQLLELVLCLQNKDDIGDRSLLYVSSGENNRSEANSPHSLGSPLLAQSLL
jgi:hypothetical protein